MILRAQKVQTKIFCSFFFSYQIFGLFYACDKVLKLFYTGVYAYVRFRLDWQLTRKYKQIRYSTSNRVNPFLKFFF